MKWTVVVAALLALTCTTTASAVEPLASTPIQEERLASGKQRLDPTKGYVFMHGPNRYALTLIKVPSEQEAAAYRAEWQEAFDRAKRKYARDIANWPADVEFRRRAGREPPPRPVEPTEQSFAIDQIERRMLVGFGFNREFSKGRDYVSYLQELEPGTYIFYATTDPGHNFWATGSCLCMGSVMFEVEAGKITNLGDFPRMRWVGTEQARASQVGWLPDASPQPVDYTIPESLAGFPSVQAEWRAAGKMNNINGVVVARMPPIPGVLAYRRDRVVDLRVSEQSGSPGAP